MRLRTPHPATTIRRILARATWSTMGLLGLCSALGPTVAHAWTRAQIRGAQAHVELVDAGTAQVALTLRVQISGGWLSELELPGLPHDIAPDPDKPPTMTSATGEKYGPSLALHRGVWRVTFADKHSAPWRGDYSLVLVYREPLSAERLESNQHRVHWSMPAWRFGIEDARIWVSAPSGSVAADRTDASSFGSHTVMRVPGRVLISHRRAQLPRDTEWPVTVDVPSGAGAIAAATIPASVHAQVSAKNEWLSQALWLPAWLLLLAWTKQHVTRRLIERRHYAARALVSNMGTTARAGLAALCAVLAGSLWTIQSGMAAIPLLAIVLLSIDRDFERATTENVRWSPASHAQLHPGWVTRLRLSLRPHAWFDVTMPIGAATLLCAYVAMAAVAVRDPRQTNALTLFALAMTPLWTTGTRLHFPWDGAKTARVLNQWSIRHQPTLAAAGVHTLPPTLSIDERGHAHDARLPLQFQAMPTGLSTIELTLVTDARSLRRRTVLLAHTLEGSPADRALRDLLSMNRVIGKRSIHMVAPEHITAAIDALAALGNAPIAEANEPDRAAA